MKIMHPLFVSVICSALLMACNQQQTTTDTNSDTATTATTNQPANPPSPQSDTTSADTTPSTLNPYMDFQVTANRAVVTSIIEDSHPHLSDEQKACLASPDGNPSYVSVLEPYLAGILTQDEINQASEFLTTEAGQHFKAMMYTAFEVPNQPPLTEPSPDVKKELDKALTMPFVQKVKAKTDAMSEEDALVFMQQIADKEIVRCAIS